MKAIIFVLATVASFSAHAFESHYGTLKQSGLNWKCTLYNDTGRTLDLKYVVFNLTPFSGDSSDHVIQNRVDTRLQPGYSTTAEASSSIHSSGGHCRFLER